ncbi:MAG TPA: hypothetical protein ENI34_02155 [candidate division WOR-3 bacterium]|uniref:Tyrosine kinase G-rich domain-containing protein n=1 Tax=candidate division WOR-3 bacterium TaxID=2052148 RepID=A0A9C9EL69_UNCW3|nr:hypothetical protein [candidate division WOR-3 bacterium]
MKKSEKLIRYLQVLLKWRYFVIKLVLITTIASLIISLLITPQFTATATILPPSSDQMTMLGMISADIPGNIAGLAKISGLSGMVTPSDLFAAIMHSGRIKGKIIRRFNLMKEFGTKTFSDASKQLDAITKIEVSPEGLISVAVTYKNKNLAADIANAYIEELDKFNRETAMTSGKKYRIFIEKRLKETEDSLTKAEESLRKFQEKHRTIALDIEIEKVIETIATLKSQIILKEVQKGASGGVNNPYTRSIEQELRELRKQLAKIEFGSKTKKRDEFGAGFSIPLSNLPEVSLEYARLLRNVKVQETIYEVLTQQYEQAKILEVKDTPTVEILDKASPPEKKSYPKRSAIVIFCAGLSLLTGFVLTFFFEYLEEIKKVSEWQEIYKIMNQDFIKFKERLFRFFKKK